MTVNVDLYKGAFTNYVYKIRYRHATSGGAGGADQKAPPGSGGAPHYYLPPRIFDPWCIPEEE